jgi:hypothetical protein
MRSGCKGDFGPQQSEMDKLNTACLELSSSQELYVSGMGYLLNYVMGSEEKDHLASK